MKNRLKRKRFIAFALAFILTFSPVFSNGPGLLGFTSFAAQTSVRQRFGNLLDGRPFDFFGRDDRTGIYFWVESSSGSPAYCIEPTKHMYDGTSLSKETAESVEDMPISITKEQYDLLTMAMLVGNNSGGINKGTYISTQAAIWAILSGDWDDIDDFNAQMSVLYNHIKDRRVREECKKAVEQFTTQVRNFSGNDSMFIPKFATKFKDDAETYQMTKDEATGQYIIELDMSDERQELKDVEFSGIPSDWEQPKFENGMLVLKAPETFTGTVQIKAVAKPGTNLYNIPNISGLGYLVSSKDKFQSMLYSSFLLEPWAYYFNLSSDGIGITFPDPEGYFTLEVHRYEHEETFKTNYKVEINKKDSETGELLSNAAFDIFEAFDNSQLNGSGLDKSQFNEEPADFTIHENIITDDNGHISHTDQKSYYYNKTYCGGHPEPEITYAEELDVPEDGLPEEIEAIEAKNEEIRAANDQLYEDAWNAWQDEVDDCEAECDFHSEDEGEAEGWLRRDRDKLFDAFINLKYDYTIQETKARPGYILHDYHNDDVPVDIVRFASSQVGGNGEVIGKFYKGEIKPASNVAIPNFAMYEATNSNAFFSMEIATSSNGTRKTSATPSNADRQLHKQLTGPGVKHISTYAGPGDDEDGPQGWDGTYENSEVSEINQSTYDKNHTGFTFEVFNHRTEGEYHINKRDLDLYKQDPDGSYGKAQGETTLEGAVYGLYAAEDIIHPDGRTGKVFSSNELVSIAATDINGDASFLCVTEVTDTSKDVPNLYDENVKNNGNQWIGRPLLLGSYYVKEISRSEGYELSVEGQNLTESNHKADSFPIAESGSVSVSALSHRHNEWDGSWNDFTVKNYRTLNGYDLYVSGYPAGSTFYTVAKKTEQVDRDVITGSTQVPKKDEHGNPVYVKAKGGEHKYDADGNWLIKTGTDGKPIYDTSSPVKESVGLTERLNVYPAGTATPSDAERYEEPDIDPDFIADEANHLLDQIGYRDPGSMYPAMTVKLDDSNNGELLDSILNACEADEFWDSYHVDSVYKDSGSWYAVIQYGYTILNKTAFYDGATGRVIIRKECEVDKNGAVENGYCYLIYDSGDYVKTGNTAVVNKKEIETPVKYGEAPTATPLYYPAYELYAEGEIMVDGDGNPIPEMETVYSYESVTEEQSSEVLTPVAADYDTRTGIYHIYIDNDVDWDNTTETQVTTFRAAAPAEEYNGDFYADYIQQHSGYVNATTTKAPFDQGSYIKEAVLLYHSQLDVYQDADTRDKPTIVLQRAIKQAVKVTKDIAQSSYEDVNTYNIHRDPFTVLYGGYRGTPGTKTLKNFAFQIFSLKELEETGFLEQDWNGTWNYKKFFEEHADLVQTLALPWDKPDKDIDGDLTTLHANQGTGVDDYYGTSTVLPYGRYLIVEIQPTQIPNKHYKIDYPKEITIPYVPEIDPDGTIHQSKPAKEYYYDAQMKPEQLMEKYHIRFNEETHVILAHNNDGDFPVYKYGLEPDSKGPYPNETVAAYYKYDSTSEDAGKKDGVYYDIYYDRNGNAVDYGITLDNVDTMAGISTMVDRQYAPALIPWSILDPRYGEVIDDEGTVGNRDTGLDPDGSFNFIAFVQEDFENHFYSSKLRIEKLDSETGENIIHAGALFKIYAAKRDVTGNGSEVSGTGDVLYNPDGTPQYDKAEQIFMRDETGAEVGIFKAFSTVRDGDVETEDGVETEKQCVGYIETYQPLGAGVYVLVEVQAPPGYVKSKPVAFEIYSDKVTYYEDGDPGKKMEAARYQYMVPLKQPEVIDVAQIFVKNKPTHAVVHKMEDGERTFTYRVYGDEVQLKKRGDAVLQYLPNGDFAGYGIVTKTYDEWSEESITGTEESMKQDPDTRPVYKEDGTFSGKGIRYKKRVGKATLTLYEGLIVEQTGPHAYDGVEVTYNLFDSVVGIKATKTGTNTDIRPTGEDDKKNTIWDTTEENNTPAELWRYDLKYDPTERDIKSGILYGLDQNGNRICMLDSLTGMAYVLDDKKRIVVWPLDDKGNKIRTHSIEVHTDENGKQTIYTNLNPVTDEQGLPVYYKDGSVTWVDNEWVSSGTAGHEIARIPFGTYILEETVTPNSQGYVRSQAAAFVVEDTTEVQHFYMEDDFTKSEFSKLDLTTREEIQGATMTLYEAYRVPDSSPKGWHLEIKVDSEGNKRIYTQWISGYKYDDNGNLMLDADGEKIPTTEPHWIDHVPPGDYILEETIVPYEWGYIQSGQIEVEIKENGRIVQGAVMENDHIAIEILKVDKGTGEAVLNDNPAILALYLAKLNDNGEVIYEDGLPLYDPDKQVYEWTTDDGKKVLSTGHEVTLPGGHTTTVYDYQPVPVPGTKQAYCYVTETGALHFEYLPVGAYVLVEKKAPVGMATAAPITVKVLEIGATVQTQKFTMNDIPLTVDLDKETAIETPLVGAVMAVYRADENGELKKETVFEDGKPVYETDGDGNLILDANGKRIPKIAYDPDALYDTWITGTDGVYSEADALAGLIPEGRKVGDYKPHRLEYIPQGTYYLVELAAPFGYIRSEEIKFEILDTLDIQRVTMTDKEAVGRVLLNKVDEEHPEVLLAGAEYKITNLDTGDSTIIVTGADGKAMSGELPIGWFNANGGVTLYHYQMQEIKAPAGYMLSTDIFKFQFRYISDLVEQIEYEITATDLSNRITVTKYDLTSKEELPGAALEVRVITKEVAEDGSIVVKEGEVIDSWISTSEPHLIKGLASGKYVLIETAPPSAGYAIAEKIYFEVKDNQVTVPSIEMYDRPTQIEILKVDGLTGEALEGIGLQLIKEGQLIRKWTTGLEPEKFTALEPGTYIIKETSTPEGYHSFGQMEIEIDASWDVQTFTVENFPIQIEISKKDSETEQIVTGAHLQLMEKQGGMILEEWVSGQEVKAFQGLKPGIYIINELKAPAGYQKGDPVEIEILDTKELQEFTVLNTKIKHSGGGGGDTPEIPVKRYVTIGKQDAETGAYVSGMEIEIYNSDGALHLHAATDQNGLVKFEIPPVGEYTFREVKAPDGYYLNETTFHFRIDENGLYQGDRIIKDHRKTTAVIHKKDAVTEASLAGAKIGIYRLDGNLVFLGTTDSNGDIYCEIPEPGTYIFKELEAPEGYRLSMTEKQFTVSWDGSITGEDTLNNYRLIGKITATYHSGLSGSGTYRLKHLTNLPRTGDDSSDEDILWTVIQLLGVVWLILYVGILLFTVNVKKNSKVLIIRRIAAIVLMIVIAFILAMSFAHPVYAAEEHDDLTQETKYLTNHSDNLTHNFLEVYVDGDGKKYLLVKVKYDVIDAKEQTLDGDILTVLTEPFMKDLDGNLRPKPEYFDVETGQTYVLQSFKTVEAVIPEHEVQADSTISYVVEALDSIPETAEVTVIDETTSQSVTSILPLTSYSLDNERWTDNFSYKLTYSEYGAGWYQLGDLIVPEGNEKPVLQGVERQLLALIGADPKDYRIDDIVWISEPYVGADGIVYRDAEAKGRKKAADCTALYSGCVVIPEAAGYCYEAEYKKKELVESPRMSYTIKATAIYKKYPWYRGALNFLKWLLAHPAATVTCVAIALLLIFVTSILLILSFGHKQPAGRK